MPAGYTLLELLIVIAIIAFLLAAFLWLGGRLRTRTKISQARNLVEKTNNALENYYLNYRSYPPQNVAGLSGSQALYYWLSTPFRIDPDASKGEVQSDMNVGPLATFDEERELRKRNGNEEIVDPWGSPLAFSIVIQDDARGFESSRPLIYSLGVNQQDDTAAGTVPNDDILAAR